MHTLFSESKKLFSSITKHEKNVSIWVYRWVYLNIWRGQVPRALFPIFVYNIHTLKILCFTLERSRLEYVNLIYGTPILQFKIKILFKIKIDQNLRFLCFQCNVCSELLILITIL